MPEFELVLVLLEGGCNGEAAVKLDVGVLDEPGIVEVPTELDDPGIVLEFVFVFVFEPAVDVGSAEDCVVGLPILPPEVVCAASGEVASAAKAADHTRRRTYCMIGLRTRATRLFPKYRLFHSASTDFIWF